MEDPLEKRSQKLPVIIARNELVQEVKNTTPGGDWLVERIKTDDVGILCESIAHFTPKVDKLVLHAFIVVVDGAEG